MNQRTSFNWLRQCHLACTLLAACAGISAGAVSIAVDPATPALTNYAGLGEWNTDGDFESWTTTAVTGATVSGGTLNGTGSAATAQISKLNFASGPDLDLGFNDVLDLRLQVPAWFTGTVSIYYGTTGTAGISAARVVTIPNSALVKDGAPHLYRMDMGLEVFWRATLRDLRVELSDASGVAFAMDYLRVGDRTGAVYRPRHTSECPAAGGTTPAAALLGPGQTVYSMESKHFRFLWNDGVAANSYWTSTMPHNTLRNAEETWQVYVNELGYREPDQAVETQSGTKYKLNITSWHGGYWAGGDTDGGVTLARLNITPDGLRENPPTWVIPHELTHCFQLHNTTGYVPGAWWEGHANYGRERWLEHYGAFFASNQRSGIDPTYLRCAHQILAEGRDYYLSWPMFLYLDENPDGLPDLGEGTMVELWQQTKINEYPLMTLERLTPNSSLKDIVGYFARREATFNYKSKADIQAALASFGTPLDNAATARWQFTDLVERSDDPTWWRVPYEMAPMQGAYAIHELVPNGSGDGRVVTVNFHGLPDSARGADWRASFIVISDTGAERYSTLWGDGTNSVTLAANENKVYLSVAGAPAVFYTGAPDNGFEGDFNESLYPYRSWPSKTRFPYELQVAGATPKVRDNGSPSGLTQHSNGGGYKGVYVPSTVYIGLNARVLGGNVSGNARIEDYAVVSGGSVSGNAIISGHAWVRGGTVNGNAKVRDWALVEGGTITLNARVLEHANIKGGTVTDIATAKGTAASLSGTLSGNAIIDGDYGDFFYGRDVSNGVAFGHQPYIGVPDNFIHPLPTGLYAAYDFATAHDSRIFDQYGATDGFLQGSPTWYASDGWRAGFYGFNGTDQYAVLDRSLSDVREMSIAAWVKWSGGRGNQPVWYFGSAATNCMYLTPDDGTGSARFNLFRGGNVQTLAWTNALPVGVWTHVVVTLSNAVTGRLYINGTLVAMGSITNTPDQLNAANSPVTPPQNYLARGSGNSLPFFRGALDDVRLYAAPMADADIAALQPPTNFSGTGTLYVDLRATNVASSASTTFTTWTNLGVSVGNFTKSGTTTYSTNVASTGIPGVLFNGTSGLYSSANTSIADITGAGDRTIEVWVYNPALASEETPVSMGDRSGTRKDCAFNFGNASGWGAVTHFNDDVPWGSMPSANAWHHLVYTYDGATTVTVYVDGVLNTTKGLSGVLATPTGDPINIGCQRASGGGGTASQYFSGYINAVRIWGGVMTSDQVAANYLFGPWTSPTSSAPTFAPISNVVINVGVTLNVTNSATDPNMPALPLTFSILSAPAGASLDASSGLFMWRPTVAQAATTNTITLKVENNAVPSLSATRSFQVIINAVSQPELSSAALSGGLFGWQINGAVGPDYLVQTSTNLSDWFTVLSTNPVAMPFHWVDTNPPVDAARFYRILLGP